MKVSDFSVAVTKLEGMKVSISIAQVKEVLKIINHLLDGALYKKIRKTEVTTIKIGGRKVEALKYTMGDK